MFIHKEPSPKHFPPFPWYELRLTVVCNSPGCSAESPHLVTLNPFFVLSRARRMAKKHGWTAGLNTVTEVYDYCPVHSLR